MKQYKLVPVTADSAAAAPAADQYTPSSAIDEGEEAPAQEERQKSISDSAPPAADEMEWEEDKLEGAPNKAIYSASIVIDDKLLGAPIQLKSSDIDSVISVIPKELQHKCKAVVAYQMLAYQMLRLKLNRGVIEWSMKVG